MFKIQFFKPYGSACDLTQYIIYKHIASVSSWPANNQQEKQDDHQSKPALVGFCSARNLYHTDL